MHEEQAEYRATNAYDDPASETHRLQGLARPKKTKRVDDQDFQIIYIWRMTSDYLLGIARTNIFVFSDNILKSMHRRLLAIRCCGL